MKITITQEFNKVEDALAFLKKIDGCPEFAVQPSIKPYLPHENAVDPAAIAASPAATKPPRKPRNDAGKPRGPYKAKDNEGAGGDLQATTASPAGQAAVPVPLSQSAAPAPAAAQAQEAQRPESQAPAAADLTQDDAKAALRRMNDTKGMGTPACIAHLQTFGVNQLSLLPKESYALFIKQADEKIAEFLAAKK